jgi:glycosyltransferase involved in cell wall biosynthesis
LNLTKKYKKIKLVFIGPSEDNTLEDLKKIFLNNFKDLVFFKPFTSKPENDLLIADVLVLPSYREGFGVSIIEAASLGIPSIGSNIHGIQDAIIDRYTGLLYKVGNPDDLGLKMEHLIKFPLVRKEMGLNAKKRIDENFTQKIILLKFVDYYKKLIIR